MTQCYILENLNPQLCKINLLQKYTDDLPAVFKRSLNRWKNYICQVLNVHNINDVRQT